MTGSGVGPFESITPRSGVGPVPSVIPSGHVLDIAASSLTLSVHQETDIHLAIPETAEFLAADLGGDPGPALDVAEHGRSGS